MDPQGPPSPAARPSRPPQPSISIPQPSTLAASRTLSSSTPQMQARSSSSELTPKSMTGAKSFESARSSRGSRDSLTSKPPPKPQDVPPIPNPNDELAKAFKSEFEDLRTLVTCKICYGLLYQPYTTSCGHTYCYSCLCKSFRPNSRQSCPECRTRLLHPPAPAFLVREMTLALIKRAELLPPGETLEQHAQWQKEHEDGIQKDRNNKDRRTGGLWRGFFRPRPRPRRAFRDIEDGVDRCPYCQWELEDGACQRCGLPFDENGTGTWDFSDIEAASERDLSSEQDLDVEIDMEDEEDGFDQDGELLDDLGLYDPYSATQPYVLRRFLQNGGFAPQYFANNHRRPAAAAHSAAGSRRRSYTASLASEMPDSEMATLEEEDEEGAEEDSSMNSFIDDEEGHGSSRASTSTSESASQTPSSSHSLNQSGVEDDYTEDEGPIPSNRRRAQRAQSRTPTAGPSSQRRSQTRSQLGSSSFPTLRNRRFISETPPSVSTASAAADEEDEDEGPIPSGRRRRRATQGSDQSRRVRPRPGERAASPAARQASEELGDIERIGYRRLSGQQSHDGDMNEGDDESDGARTTVGWEPITISNERTRNAGSLTPTADRLQHVPRPPSRTGSARLPAGARALRRRSSVLSVSTVHYEDNDADNDMSETDQDGDVDMTQPVLRQPPSRIRLRNNTTPQPITGATVARSQAIPENVDIDSDETDISSRPNRRGQQIRQRQQEYNPQISRLFAQHQTQLSEVDFDNPVTFSEYEQLRAITRTPLARPRTANRNRITTHPGIAAQGRMLPSPGPLSRAPPTMNTHARPRNSIDGNAIASMSTSGRGVLERSISGPSRVSMTETSHINGTTGRAMASPSEASMSGPSSPTPTIRSLSQASAISTMSTISAARAGESIERPASRVSFRPPSASSSRRGSLARSPFTAPPQLSPMSTGLGTVRNWHNNNPFFNIGTVRPRQSSQRLREQSSTATLRPRNSVRTLRQQPSQRSIRETAPESRQVRPQASRLHLGTRTSIRGLQAQAVRDASMAHIAQAAQVAGNQRFSPSTASTLSEDERQRRANELVQRRMQEIAEQQGNPFARRPRPGHTSSQQALEIGSSVNAGHLPTSSRLGSISSGPANSGITYNMQQSASPVVGRRRSNRSLAGAHQGVYVPTPTTHTANTGSLRARNNHMPAGSAYESNVHSNMIRGMAPLTTGGDHRRN